MSARRPSREAPSDGAIYRRALGVGAAGVAAALLLVGLGAKAAPFGLLKHLSAPAGLPAVAREPETPRAPAPLTEALRKKGYHECNPHDPIGLGPYAPYRNLNIGRIAIPQRGGHTADMGFDVLIHFHGHSPVRKTLVQVARGVAFVGIDKGIGSGRYSKPFAQAEVFPRLLASIQSALRSHTHDEGAHIRHVGLSAWSAGYGAVNEILKHHSSQVDAVILLDGLHAAWNPASPKRDGSLSSLSGLPITPTIDYARRALRGEGLFVFTHGTVDPEKYPSTEATANLLLSELGVARSTADPSDDPYGPTGRVDQSGFHLWSYRGGNELAHCTHIQHIAPALALVEQAWNTPALDRNVPPTPAPKLGGGAGEEEPTPGVTLELVDEPSAEASPAEPMAPGGTPTIQLEAVLQEQSLSPALLPGAPAAQPAPTPAAAAASPTAAPIHPARPAPSE